MDGFWIAWFVLALIVAAAAPGRGRNALAWFLAAVLLSPLLALIALVISPNLKEREARAAMDARQLAATEASTLAIQLASSHPRDQGDIARTLSQLADLRDRGAITAEEFEAKKTELLARL